MLPQPPATLSKEQKKKSQKRNRQDQIPIDTTRHPKNTARLTHFNQLRERDSRQASKRASKQRRRISTRRWTTVFEINKEKQSKTENKEQTGKTGKNQTTIEGSSDDLVRRCEGTNDSRLTHLDREGIVAIARRIFTVILFLHARTASLTLQTDRTCREEVLLVPNSIAVGHFGLGNKLGSLSSLILLARRILWQKWVQHSLGISA